MTHDDGSQWYCRIKDEEIGPLTSRQVKELASAGELSPSDQVRRSDSDTWRKAGSMTRLFADPSEEETAKTANAQLAIDNDGVNNQVDEGEVVQIANTDAKPRDYRADDPKKFFPHKGDAASYDAVSSIRTNSAKGEDRTQVSSTKDVASQEMEDESVTECLQGTPAEKEAERPAKPDAPPVRCPVCSREWPVGTTKCAKCSTVIPLTDDIELQTPKDFGFLKKLFQAGRESCNAFNEWGHYAVVFGVIGAVAIIVASGNWDTLNEGGIWNHFILFVAVGIPAGALGGMVGVCVTAYKSDISFYYHILACFLLLLSVLVLIAVLAAISLPSPLPRK